MESNFSKLVKMGEEKKTLGSMLKDTLNELESANIKTLSAQAAAELDKIRKQKHEKSVFTDGIKELFKTQIETHKVPYKKVTDYTTAEWVRNAMKGTAEFQDVWNNLIFYFNKQQCALVVNEEHDGIGMAGWIVITLKPQLTATRGIV